MTQVPTITREEEIAYRTEMLDGARHEWIVAGTELEDAQIALGRAITKHRDAMETLHRAEQALKDAEAR